MMARLLVCTCIQGLHINERNIHSQSRLCWDVLVF